MPYKDLKEQRCYWTEWARKQRAAFKAQGLGCRGNPLKPQKPKQEQEQEQKYIPSLTVRTKKYDWDRTTDEDYR